MPSERFSKKKLARAQRAREERLTRMQKGTAWPWLTLTLFIVVMDQITKGLITSHFKLYESLDLLPFLKITLLHNPGAAFSMLADADGWQRWFFTSVSSIISIVLFFWILQLPRHQYWLAIALALILGGALGNLWDRIEYGYVVDFIDVYYQDWHWPAFNIADTAISIGAVMLLLDTLFNNHSDSDEEKSAADKTDSKTFGDDD